MIFAQGLDDGADGETDDITLMERAQFDRRWQQHASETPEFDFPEDPVEVP